MILKEGKPWTLAVVAIYRAEVGGVCGDASENTGVLPHYDFITRRETL
jgi:hypothetical protein